MAFLFGRRVSILKITVTLSVSRRMRSGLLAVYRAAPWIIIINIIVRSCRRHYRLIKLFTVLRNLIYITRNARAYLYNSTYFDVWLSYVQTGNCRNKNSKQGINLYTYKYAVNSQGWFFQKNSQQECKLYDIFFSLLIHLKTAGFFSFSNIIINRHLIGQFICF